MRKKLNDWADASRILHGFVILGFILAFMVSIFSCQEYYIGKSEEELRKNLSTVETKRQDNLAKEFGDCK